MKKGPFAATLQDLRPTQSAGAITPDTESVEGPDEPMNCARSQPRGLELTREYQQHQSSG